MQRFELGLSMINELTPRGRFVSLAASKGHSCSRARLPTVERYPTAPIRPRFARRPPGQAGGNEGPHPYRPAQKSIIPSSLGGVSPRPAPGKSSSTWSSWRPLLHEVGKSLPPGADPGVSGEARRMGCGKQECLVEGSRSCRRARLPTSKQRPTPHPARRATFPSSRRR